jgi:hypothetical protein
VKNGGPERIRTSDLPLRRRLLYPAELRVPRLTMYVSCHDFANRRRHLVSEVIVDLEIRPKVRVAPMHVNYQDWGSSLQKPLNPHA